MSAQALVCLVPGNEEVEAITTINLLVRGEVKVTTTGVANDGDPTIVCPRGVKLLTDTPLVEVIGGDSDITALPDGIKGAECFRDSSLLIGTVKQSHRSEHIVTATCAVAATALIPHDISPIGSITGSPALKDQAPADQQQDRRVVWDPRVSLLTSQGPGTSINLGLKIIDLLVSREKAREVVSQLVMAAGIYNYYE